jgi:hypothetical protein
MTPANMIKQEESIAIETGAPVDDAISSNIDVTPTKPKTKGVNDNDDTATVSTDNDSVYSAYNVGRQRIVCGP